MWEFIGRPGIYYKLNTNCPNSEKVGGEHPCSGATNSYDALSDKQKRILADYTNGQSYDITPYLLYHKINDFTNEKDIKHSINELDKITNNNIIDKGKYFHGINNKILHIIKTDFNIDFDNVNSIFTYSPFMSLTSDENLSQEFSYDDNINDKGRILEINIPTDHKGITLKSNNDPFIEDWQHESILPRNSKFKVGNTYIKNKMKYTILELI